LGQLVKSVTALESDEDLVSQATVALRNLAGNNVGVVTGQLEPGWPDAGPYDVILLGGSIEFVPAELFAQLAIGGRLVAVIGSGNAASGTVFVKGGAAIGSRRTFNAALPPLPGFAKPRTFVF
jgi:protein-L-isoaspartate(D-aspartate) O-methyltransferase